MPAANAETMSLHLTAIGRKVAAGSHAALVLDGAGYHIAAALTIPENVTLVRLPPYAPELNPIENVWEYLRGNKLAITVFDDYDDIVDKTCDAWNFFEQDPNRIASITTRTWATVNQLGPLVLPLGLAIFFGRAEIGNVMPRAAKKEVTDGKSKLDESGRTNSRSPRICFRDRRIDNAEQPRR